MGSVGSMRRMGGARGGQRGHWQRNGRSRVVASRISALVMTWVGSWTDRVLVPFVIQHD